MPVSGYTIRAITPDEVDAWWELRLRSLRDHPDAFGADYDSTRQRGTGYLYETSFGREIDTLFGAFAPDGTLVAQLRTIGNTGKREHIAVIISVYTAPEHRGRGLSQQLIALAIDHCRSFPTVRQISIGVNATNAAALAVYTGAGFIPWGTEPRALRTDTGFHDEIHMVLRLDEKGADDGDTAHT